MKKVFFSLAALLIITCNAQAQSKEAADRHHENAHKDSIKPDGTIFHQERAHTEGQKQERKDVKGEEKKSEKVGEKKENHTEMKKEHTSGEGKVKPANDKKKSKASSSSTSTAAATEDVK